MPTCQVFLYFNYLRQEQFKNSAQLRHYITLLYCHCVMKYVLLCTVTDYTVRNVALLKPSFQSTMYVDQYGRHPASLANDGNRQTNYSVSVGGCAASEPETNPWWAVDLGGPTLVFMVNLTNRGDAEGTYRTCHLILLIIFS